MIQRRIDRATYLNAKALCAAKINQLLVDRKLTPKQVQDLTAQAVGEGRELKGITMADLTHYRSASTMPKGPKLVALAAVLQCKPSDLVPEDMQGQRTLVARGMNGVSNDDFKVTVSDSRAFPGHQLVELRIMLPAHKAQALAQALAKQNTIEHMRRHGMSEEKIRETIEPAPKRYAPDGFEIQ